MRSVGTFKHDDKRRYDCLHAYRVGLSFHFFHHRLSYRLHSETWICQFHASYVLSSLSGTAEKQKNTSMVKMYNLFRSGKYEPMRTRFKKMSESPNEDGNRKATICRIDHGNEFNEQDVLILSPSGDSGFLSLYDGDECILETDFPSSVFNDVKQLMDKDFNITNAIPKKKD